MPRYAERAYKGDYLPHWHDVEIMQETVKAEMEYEETRYRAEKTEYVGEQIDWWQEQGIPAHEAYEALYGKPGPWCMGWTTLRDRMVRDFT